MNSLTVNLHLMMATFYRPTKSRFKILMEEPAFPSDTYAIKTQIAHHGLNPRDALILARPRNGEFTIQTEDIVDLIEKHRRSTRRGDVCRCEFFHWPIVRYQENHCCSTEQAASSLDSILPMRSATCRLSLHDWNVDFAVWCSYKYLNAGPGAVAGAFVHERHATNTKLPRFAGWFGNDPNTRFRLHLEPEFNPVAVGRRLANQ